jgi:uncharacterized protein (DUF3084 family)
MAISQEKSSIRHEGMTILHEQTSIFHEGLAIRRERTSIRREKTSNVQEKAPIFHEGTWNFRERMAILRERRASGRQHSWPDCQRMARGWMTDGELTRDSEGARERTQEVQRRSEQVSRRFSLGDYLGPGLQRCPRLS